jgi:hypothetical protein
MTLKDKIQVVLDKYNGGISNKYSEDMLRLIESSKTYNEIVVTEFYVEHIIMYSINELIGVCIMANNPNLFKSANKDTYLDVTEHCPH